jgi:putative hemolysin
MPTENAVRGARGHDQLALGGSFHSARLRFLFNREIRRLYESASLPENGPFLDKLLAELRVKVRVADKDLSRVPADGPLLAIANHPFGILDGAMLLWLLLRVRPDTKILTNYLLSSVPELERYCIFVDPFKREHSAQANRRGLKQAISHLKDGGALAVFPAGEVSHWQFKDGEVSDPAWTESIVRFVRRSQAVVLPVLFAGTNSLPFQVLGVIHPVLRTMQIPQQLLNKAGKEIDVRIGNPVPAEKVCSIRCDRDATAYLRWRTYLLAEHTRRNPPRMELIRRQHKPIAAPIPAELLVSEIQGLPERSKLDENREFAVYSARAHEIPNCILEVGRLREVTFRAVEEGTGASRDIDEFDGYYTHLLLWSKPKQEIVGAYRLGNTREILAERGLRGLYTSTLFSYNEQLFCEMGPALELGRSFIRQEYQRQHAPLLMLWKGIAQYVVRNPETPILFGAVSISSSYRQRSRELLVKFFESQPANRLSKYVRPKRSFRVHRKIREWESVAISHLLDLDELSESIAEIERDGKGIPVLLRQYLKVGGSVLEFNVDRQFCDVLDGLILVDLRKTDPTRLATYMSKEGVTSFYAYHGVSQQHSGGHLHLTLA